MQSSHSCLALFALLASDVLALPHDEQYINVKLSKTVVVTGTHTLEEASPFSTPPANIKLLCPTPGEPCTLDGISTWPSGTMSLVASGEEEAKTTVLDPVASAGMNNAHMTSTERGEELEQASGAEDERKAFWATMFARADPRSHAPAQMVLDEDEAEDYQERKTKKNKWECVQCDEGRDLVCINGTHFGFCDEGCPEPRRLKDGMKCVDGKIFRARP
ncbi:hypothetical protein BDU57DRAFT_516165 [Ampelomyces quisqualis]|uniref:Uncharacterized protein n=1 Tax=Ampelomyces quisqualis TaxID=50730 RepID=A0A6A5QL75_AMPQU|nr:hypothetical protein BDU57DRAFT_516165 [Ampelomyces quisqualis]